MLPTTATATTSKASRPRPRAVRCRAAAVRRVRLHRAAATFAVNAAAIERCARSRGVRYRLTGIYEGIATRDTRRGRLQAPPRARAGARRDRRRARSRRGVKVLDDAMAEADKILNAQTTPTSTARRTTAQEATATRLRVEELRALATDAHRQLSPLPAPERHAARRGARDVSRLPTPTWRRARRSSARVQAYRRQRARRRRRVPRAHDVAPRSTSRSSRSASTSARSGSGGANDRAAAGRKQLRAFRARSARRRRDDRARADDDRARRQARRADRRRSSPTSIASSPRSRKIGGDESKRYRQTVWFDWVKAKAEHAYYSTHVQTLHEVLGGGSE